MAPDATLSVPGATVSIGESGNDFRIAVEDSDLRSEKLLGGLFGALLLMQTVGAAMWAHHVLAPERSQASLAPSLGGAR